MYTSFYGFREKPFTIVSDPEFLYLSQKHRMALTYLEYGLMDGLGFILLTGEIGTGKTTLIKSLLKKIRAEMDVAVVFNTNVSPGELL
ncbi:MAG: type IV secretion system DNA-binding domain-containing protein, partial [Deltaproteobacteria bacterium]|nr:type IV secretion system DNA-binding domain-containing protein [Deltaproteobacteria bacterium]